MVYKALNGRSLQYQADDYQFTTTIYAMCELSRTRTSLGSRPIAAAGLIYGTTYLSTYMITLC